MYDTLDKIRRIRLRYLRNIAFFGHYISHTLTEGGGGALPRTARKDPFWSSCAALDLAPGAGNGRVGSHIMTCLMIFQLDFGPLLPLGSIVMEELSIGGSSVWVQGFTRIVLSGSDPAPNPALKRKTLIQILKISTKFFHQMFFLPFS